MGAWIETSISPIVTAVRSRRSLHKSVDALTGRAEKNLKVKF